MNTEILKAAIIEKFGQLDLKRISKRKMDYNKSVILVDDSNEVVLEGEINWRCFKDSDDDSFFYTFDNGTEILLISESALLPSNYFKYAMFDCGEGFALFLDLKGDKNLSKDGVFSDCLGEDSVAGLTTLFSEIDIEVCEIMENTFQLSGREGTERVFLNFKEFEDTIKRMMNNAGFKHSKELELNLYEESSGECKEDFVENVLNLMSVEELNSYINHTN